MPNPTKSLATLRPDLGESFEQFDLAQQKLGYIGQDVLPVKNVNTKTGTYGVIPKEELLKNASVDRAPGAAYSRASTRFTDASWLTRDRGHEEAVDDSEADAYRNYFDAEQVAAMRAMDVVLREAEKRTAALLENTSTFNTTAAGVKWDLPGTADPVLDVIASKRAFRARTGQIPNFLIVPLDVLWDLIQVDDVKSNSNAVLDARAGAIANAAFLRVLFDIEEIFIPGVSKLTSAEGQSTVTLADIWVNTKVFVGVRTTGEDIKRVTVGRTFHWGADGSSAQGTIEEYRDESRRSQIIRVRHETDEQVIYSDAGQIITGVK